MKIRSIPIAIVGVFHAVTVNAQTAPESERALLAAARTATVSITTPDDAHRAGFVPVFGNAPLQGIHYARPDLVMRDSFDLATPSVVMFAPIDGKQTLVGVAYTYYLPSTQLQPKGWHGAADAWHSHDDLARIPGKHLVMMHVWLIASPDGVLAHFNPALVGSSRVDLQACKLEYSIVSPK